MATENARVLAHQPEAGPSQLRECASDGFPSQVSTLAAHYVSMRNLRLSNEALTHMIVSSSRWWFVSILLKGGAEEPWLFSFLWAPGLGREAGSLILRRLFTRLLDAGVGKPSRRNPVAVLAALCLLFVAIACALLRMFSS